MHPAACSPDLLIAANRFILKACAKDRVILLSCSLSKHTPVELIGQHHGSFVELPELSHMLYLQGPSCFIQLTAVLLFALGY